MSMVDVLHIDDDPDIREIVGMTIGCDPMFTLQSCGSGEEALAATANWSPDLILLDVNMPGMDGPTTLARLQQRPQTADVPVIYLTAAVKTQGLAGPGRHGVAGIIAKPFDPATLGGQINAVLCRRLRKLEHGSGLLERSAEMALSIVEGSRDGIVAKDLGGTILLWNAAAERMSNYKADEVIGRKYHSLMPEARFATATPALEPFKNGQSIESQAGRVQNDGALVDVSLTELPIRDRAGHIIGSASVARDISERRRTEEKLRHLHASLEQRVADKTAALSAIINGIPSMIAYWDKDLRCHFANSAYIEWFGRQPEQLIGASMPSMLGDSLFAINEPFVRAALSGRTQNFERTLTKADGSVGHTWANYIPHRNDAGDVLGFFVLVTDVTPMWLAEQRLQESEARYRLLAEHSSDMIFQLDRDLVRRYVSPAYRETLGYEEADLLGNRTFELIHPDDVEARKTSYDALLTGTITRCSFVDRIRHSDGRWIWVEGTMRAYRHPATGEIDGIVGSLRDISDRKAIEAEIRQRGAQLELANRELDDFAYAASHDLKAPLRTIDNASKWLEEDLAPYLSGETLENMRLLRGRVARMEKLLDDLLQFSRIGRDQGGTEFISGLELIDDVLALVNKPEGFEISVTGFDKINVGRMPLQQILLNLISNAIKHHDKKAGRIMVKAEDLGSQQAFAVSDDGPGIAAPFHDKIFQMFQTLKPRDQVEGSGMGLAIVRKQIDLSGGSLTLESAEGVGSTFRFTLPAPDQAV